MPSPPSPIDQLKTAWTAFAHDLASPRSVSVLPEPDPAILQSAINFLAPICERYFRSEVRHLDRIPKGSTLLIGNHDGGPLPTDALCLGVAWYKHFEYQRSLRVLVHEIPFHVTGGLTRWLNGIGAVSAAPANLEKLLDAGESVLLYPGAAREAYRTFRNRAEIDLGGRSGFVVRAIRRNIPVTPVASAGAHEQFIVLMRGGKIARWAGIYKYLKADAWPIIAGLPWGIWFGPMFPYLPLPSKITVEVQQPIDLRDELSAHFHREIRASDADDPEVVRAGFVMVRESMRSAVRRLYGERKYPIIG